jgi:hypothetical protein
MSLLENKIAINLTLEAWKDLLVSVSLKEGSEKREIKYYNLAQKYEDALKRISELNSKDNEAIEIARQALL